MVAYSDEKTSIAQADPSVDRMRSMLRYSHSPRSL
jgi:hypothetical protein